MALGFSCTVLLGLSLLSQPFHKCLPPGRKLTDIVSATIARPEAGIESSKTTVEQKLIAIKARCKKGKLVDSSGKEIRFYLLTGCWGNPPEDYREVCCGKPQKSRS